MRTPIRVNTEVYDGIMACRSAGPHNMFDQTATIIWCLGHGYYDAADWAYQNKLEYVAGIFNGFTVKEA